MSYKVQVTSVKPANAKWFNEVDPTRFESYKIWVNTLSGLVISQTNKKPDANTIIRTYEFVNEDAYKAYVAAHNSNTDDQLRQAHNNTNGITTTFKLLNA